MQASTNNIILLVTLITCIFLIAGGFLIVYISLYNDRKRKHLEEKKKMHQEFENQLLHSQIEIQEQTFNYISQEIHDNVGQILSLAKVQINIMNESEDINKGMLEDVKENVSKAMTDLRDIAKSLSSERIRALGIYETLINEAERINKSGILQVELLLLGSEQKMNEQKKLILFRIIQESLQNSIKHANASKVDICFNYQPENLQVSINDNGNGFDITKTSEKNAGLGLLNIKTRAALTGGSSSITSELNKGTSITINIPYE
jgi:two-component system NarL family sensor kinase